MQSNAAILQSFGDKATDDTHCLVCCLARPPGREIRTSLDEANGLSYKILKHWRHLAETDLGSLLVS